MCAHMNVMSINGIVSQYSMTIIRQLRGDTPHKLSEQIKTIYWEWSLSKIIKYSESIFANKRRGQKSLLGRSGFMIYLWGDDFAIISRV